MFDDTLGKEINVGNPDYLLSVAGVDGLFVLDKHVVHLLRSLQDAIPAGSVTVLIRHRTTVTNLVRQHEGPRIVEDPVNGY